MGRPSKASVIASNGKLPWFPFYPSRFIGSRRVRRMSAEDVGIYILLMIDEWKHGPLTSNGDDLTWVCNGADIKAVRRVLRQCFEKTPAGWVNPELEEIRKAQLERHKRRVSAGRKGGKAKRDNEKASSA